MDPKHVAWCKSGLFSVASYAEVLIFFHTAAIHQWLQYIVNDEQRVMNLSFAVIYVQ